MGEVLKEINKKIRKHKRKREKALECNNNHEAHWRAVIIKELKSIKFWVKNKEAEL